MSPLPVCGPRDDVNTVFPIAFTDEHERTGRLSQWFSNMHIHEEKDNRRRIQLASHLHNPTNESPYDLPAAKPLKRTTLWWCDNILDSKRLFPAPSSTRVISIRLTRHWTSRAKDVGLKAPFEPPPE